MRKKDKKILKTPLPVTDKYTYRIAWLVNMPEESFNKAIKAIKCIRKILWVVKK
jgi:hypothetical protein